MKDELIRFIGYLEAGNGINVVKGCEKLCSEEWLKSFQKNLKPYECPDMISLIEDEVAIFEHFQFDGTKKTSKGMKGIQEESKVRAEIDDFYSKGEEGTFTTGTKKIESKEDYWRNFTYVFESHYTKIDNYKHNLYSINNNSKRIITGFCIENRYPPYTKYIKQKNKKFFFTEVCLIELSEFLDIFEESDNLDFVILCGVYDSKGRVIFVNKKMVPYLRKYSYSIKDIDFWNANEVIFASLFNDN